MTARFASERCGVRVGVPAIAVLLALSATLSLPHAATAQQVGNGEEIVELNLSGTVKVTTLLEVMSKQLGVRFLHGTDIARRDVTVYTPARLPKNVLPTLLGSLLREANLAIVDSEVPGWKRVVDIADIVNAAPAGNAEEISRRNGPAAAVTQVLPIRYIDATSSSTLLKAFMSRTGSNIVALSDQGLLIVSGYAQDVRLVGELLEMIDRPDAEGTIEFYQARRRPPSMLIEQYESIRQVNTGKPDAAKESAKLLVDSTGRRVVVAGRKESVAAAIGLLERLDSGTEYLTRVYRLEYIGASRLDNLIQGFVEMPGDSDPDRERGAVETTIDEEGNLLVVRAGAEVHQQIEKLLKELDRPVDSEASPIRYYKLKNANAIEVLYSLLALQEATGGAGAVEGGMAFGAFGTLQGANAGGVIPATTMGAVPPNQFGAVGPGGMNMTNGGVQAGRVSSSFPAAQRTYFNLGSEEINNNFSSTRNPNQNAALGTLGGGFYGGAMAGGGNVAMLPGGARVSADVSTNSLIVFAPSNIQSLYEKLILSLDQRRPQVLIQADIVAIDTSDDFSLGVEISGGDRLGAKRYFKFTSFGLSEVDPTNGHLTINPAIGFNGVVVDPEVADVVVQAVSTHNRGRVLSSPKLLVNDNQTGTLNSVSSVPFAVTSQGFNELTSVGGNQEAGTTIQVTPHINEDNHLQLEFDIEFSTFVGAGTNDLPPPRQIDRVGSVVTIPDGKTVIVGGLKRTAEGSSFAGVPWLENIPILRELTSLRTEQLATTSFFVFLRPRILRDSQFRDLRFLSDVDTYDASLPADYPVSQPLLISGPASSGTPLPGGADCVVEDGYPIGERYPTPDYETLGDPSVTYPSAQ